MNAAYLALNSYADTGTVVDDAGGFADKSQFKTLYTRNPRNLLITRKEGMINSRRWLFTSLRLPV